MWISNVLAGVLMLVLGMLIRVFNLSGLIAGYNTSSPEKKARYNERALTRFVGMMLISSGAVLAVGGVFILLDVLSFYMMAISWAVFFVVMIFGLFYVNLSPRFKSQK